MKTLFIILVILGFVLTVLAFIGLKVKKTEATIKKQLETQSKVRRANEIQQKQSRKRTPKVPTRN